MRCWKLLLLLFVSNLCWAQADRIAGPVSGEEMIPLQGNVHGLARPEFDEGRAAGSRILRSTSLVMKPSAAQQGELNALLEQQRDRTSLNYHKWLTPAQFADKFGLGQNDLAKVNSWLQSQGLTVTRIANSRNQIFFEGTVAQIENAFKIEIHNYLVNGELHYSNSGEPSIPAALAGVVLAVHNLHNFQPRPHTIFRKVQGSEAEPHFASHLSGDHFVAPGDFATIYDVNPLYNDGNTGSGANIAVTGQSSISLNDVANFRSASGLAAKAPTLLLMPGTGISTRCAGDEGESDLDLEWSGGVAKNASITLVYAGVTTGDTCTNRQFGAFDALQYAVDNKVAPIIANSYGNCESNVGESEADTIQGWVQQANSQGQTVLSASGDSGAADCDYQVSSATHGLAVDVPGAIPEVTAMGGTEFTGDSAGTVTNGNASATQYWSGTTGGNDTISSALSYIPEETWNDTSNSENTGSDLAASGGGTSIFFSKPSWQTGTGVPNDGKRDMPDLALNASPFHDGYLFCSEDGPNGTIVQSCTNGFRESNGDLAVVGGTSAAAPTFAGVLSLISQHLGLTGLGNINPTLYALASSHASAFHDITTGNNIVPCTQGTTDCPATAPFQYGFTATTGYDQVTGLGSIDVNALAVAWAASLDPDFQLSATPTTLSVSAGQAQAATITLSAVSGSTGMVVNFSPSSCSGLPAGATCSFNPQSVNFDGTDSASTVVTISTPANMALPTGAQNITIIPTNSPGTSVNLSLTVSKTSESFALSTTAATFPVSVGGTAKVLVSVSSSTGFVNASNSTTVLPLTYSCSGIPATAEISCQISNNGQPTSATTVTVDLVTTPVTSKLNPWPFGNMRIRYASVFPSPIFYSPFLYASILPGFFGILFVRPPTRKLRMLSLLLVLGCSTALVTACGGKSNSNNASTATLQNAGTPSGNYTVTITATTGGAVPISSSLPITLSVSAQ